MSTVDSDAPDDTVEEAELPGDPSDWDEEWLPEWVNVEDDGAGPEQSDSALDDQLTADLEAVERLVASLLTESSAAFEASVGGWEPDEPDQPDEPGPPDQPGESEQPGEPEQPPAPAEPTGPAEPADLSSVRVSLGVGHPVPERTPQAPPPPTVVSPPARRRQRRWRWLVAPLVLLLAGAVIGTFLWAGSSRRPTPAAAVHSELGTSSALPTWTRPTDSAPTEPPRDTAGASSTSAVVPSVRPVRRHLVRAAPRPSAPPTTPSTADPSPTDPAPTSSPTDTVKVGSTSGPGNPSCTSAATTDSTPLQTTGSTSTSTETTTTTSASTETSTQTSTATQTTTPTLASQPSVGTAVSCSG